METPVGAAVTARERVLLELARRDKSDVQATFRAITEATSVVLNVARVSIWKLLGESGVEPVELKDDAEHVKIVCQDLYLMNEGHHVSFMPIHGKDFPSYLSAIHERRTITANDAMSNPLTREFASFYLKPLGISSMMDVPIWHRGGVYGVLCLEHVGASRTWQADEVSFAINMTDIAAASLEAGVALATRSRCEAILQSLAEGVVVLDARGAMFRCNRAARRAFLDRAGVETWEALMAEVDLVDAADRRIAATDMPLQRALRREIVRGEIYGMVFKKSGEHRYMRLTCSPVVEDAQIKYVVFVMVDATEEVTFERLKRELLSGLAHELKTPLTIAKGYAQQLENANQIPENWSRMLDQIIRACDRMDHLSETLLDLASMILGRLCLTRERVDLTDLALSVIRRAERGPTRHRFQLELMPRIPVIVDNVRVVQAMRHLIDNAIAYSAPESVIEVTLTADRDKVEMSVRDHGIGIPVDAQRSIFELFYKAHAGTAHDKGGLGIGLYLAREILRRHGGELWFESVEGEGSTFHMVLPREESS